MQRGAVEPKDQPKVEITGISAPAGEISADQAAVLFFPAQAGLHTLLFERGASPGGKNAAGCGLDPRVWRSFDLMEQLTPAFSPSTPEGRAIRHHLVDESGQVAARMMTRPTRLGGLRGPR